jgi:Xaa-Pro aminopeptidase
MTEFERRINMLREALERHAVDLAAIGPTDTMRYLAGFASHPDERLCVLLISTDDVAVVVPSLNAGEWEARSSLPLYPWSDSDGPAAALEAALSRLGRPRVRRLAVDGEMRADFALSLMQATAHPEALPLAALNASLRLCKSPEEIERLQRAATQADRAMQAAVDACRPGVSEAQVAWAAEAAFRLDGADEVCFTIIGSGPNSAFPHHHSGQRVLQVGDAVVIDIGASLEDYKSDITRVVHLGEPSAEFLQVYDAVRRASERGRAAVRPGTTAGAVDAAARSVIEAAGYGPQFVHRTGHGLGLSIHEPPWIIAGSDEPLQTGMVFSIEPGIYLAGKFGVRIEDIVVVTDSGVHNFTGFDHDLIVK